MKYLIWIISLLTSINVFADVVSNTHGHLEQEQGQWVLHLKGSPYEMGYRHGELLKEAIAKQVQHFADDLILKNPDHPVIKKFLESLPLVTSHIPKEYIEEMRGLAEGSEQPYEKILLINLLPEMFHCLGLTVSGQATADQELYHVRVLDYGFGKGLQEHAILMVIEPEGRHPFCQVSYAGFIGCITGMNARRIAVGEIGGWGYGEWDGVPMAFLLRNVLEQTGSLDEVKALLSSAPRTCEYYYVFSDGNSKESIGAYATHQQLQWILPGSMYALFLPISDPKITNDNKFILENSQIASSPFQTLLYSDPEQKQLWGLIHHQPADCLLIIGFSTPNRYPILMDGIKEHYGNITVEVLQELIKAPVTPPSNLHNAIFAPTSLDLWVSHAGPKDEPASSQPYYKFNLVELLQSTPQSLVQHH